MTTPEQVRLLSARLENSPSLPLELGWKGEKIQVWVVWTSKTPESHFGQTFDLRVKAKLVECDEYQAKLGAWLLVASALITIRDHLIECTLAKRNRKDKHLRETTESLDVWGKQHP